MGYMYEEEGDNDNSLYSFVIGRKNMMSKENLGSPPAVLGIPQKLRLSAKEYFWQRRYNVLFHDTLCADHGFAGGYMLYQSLKKLHYSNAADSIKSPVDKNKLIWSPEFFQWYNVPSAWAIICHNIWTAAAGTGTADKYESLGLGNLIFAEDDSPVRHKNHPLLFLLDFVDTIDPYKRVKEIDKIRLTANSDSMEMSFDCPDDSLVRTLCKEKMEKIDSSLAFLKSPAFQVELAGNNLIFKF